MPFIETKITYRINIFTTILHKRTNAYLQTRFVSIVEDFKCNYNVITNRNY